MATRGTPELPSAETTPRSFPSPRRASAPIQRGATPIEELDSIEEIEPDLDSVPPSIPSAATAVSPGAISAQPILPGHLIAQRYEVINVLGEGGMGIVYRCRDQATSDLVAVKRVILPEGKLAAEYVGWFY